ncbi:MAG: beta-N-acetylhexosaminidase [Legionellales bacterium]|nr:beta-N-acetylhexosaminidase [Legionellales bacterium]
MIGPIIADIQGTELSQDDRTFLVNPLIGGIILFTRNYTHPSQLKALVSEIKSLPRTDPLLVSVDHEGGSVQRFRQHFTKLPPMAALGRLYATNSEKAKQTAFQIGWLLAAELRQYGVDYSYAPVLDVDYQKSRVIGERAFHADTAILCILASALIEGMHEVGMAVTGKHFPGHGGVSADSHLTLPVDPRSFDTLWNADIVPYIKLIEKNYLESVMTAHIVYSEIDQNPVCFSPFWVKSILRDKLQFDGVIISDDLTMEGAAIVGDYGKRASLALKAGCDMLLICNNRQAVIQVIEEISGSYVFDSQVHRRCQRLYAQSLPDNFDQHPNWNIYKAEIEDAKLAF